MSVVSQLIVKLYVAMFNKGSNGNVADCSKSGNCKPYPL